LSFSIVLFHRVANADGKNQVARAKAREVTEYSKKNARTEEIQKDRQKLGTRQAKSNHGMRKADFSTKRTWQTYQSASLTAETYSKPQHPSF
jgi:hypothetical protein